MVLFKVLLSTLVIMLVSSIFVSGSSCDIVVNPTIVDLSDYSQDKVTVTGEGISNNFDASSSIQINCNEDGTKPGAVQNIVEARIPAFSEKELSYKGYCSYKPSDTNVDYKIKVTLLPTNVVCTDGVNTYARVTVKGFSKVEGDTSCKNADEVYDSNSKQCLKCGDYGQNKCGDGVCRNGWKLDSNGKCTEKIINSPTYDSGGKLKSATAEGKTISNDGFGNTISGIIQQTYTVINGQAKLGTKSDIDTSQQPKELRFGIDNKWNLIGVPYGDIVSEDHACLPKMYWHDPKINAYMVVTDLKDKKLIGKGLWAKKTVGNKVGGCTIKYTGQFLLSQIIELKKGWNLISVQTEKSIDATKSTSCKINGGPFMYSGFLVDSKGAWSATGKPQGYIKRDSLNYGNGYWIKVAEDCKLSSEEEEEAPPASPEFDSQITSKQAIESQGARGRRFVEDAG